MLKKVISGGQTGADQAGLIAARKFQLETGGWIPHGFRTEDGPNWDLAKYDLIETTSSGYIKRTEYNVRDSDATVYFASNWKSPGTLCTLKAAKKLEKPAFRVDITIPSHHQDARGELFKDFLLHWNVETLNVAGHRESGHPGVTDYVVSYLSAVFQGLGLIEA